MFLLVLGPSAREPDVRKPSNLTITTNGTPCTPTGVTGADSSSGNHGNKADIARHHIASELLHTEKNFVKILNLVVNVRNSTCIHCLHTCT